MIGKLLGHNKIDTTARYAHLARDSLPALGASDCIDLKRTASTTFLPHTRHGIPTRCAPLLSPATALGFTRGWLPEPLTSVIQ